MTQVTYGFEFISNYNGKSDYRLFRDGKHDTRITANLATLRLTYADSSPVLKAETKAFNAMISDRYHAAALAYPEFTGDEKAPVFTS